MAARFALGVVAIILAGISGAVAALGDTLYPAGSLAQALSADLSPTAHALVRLRLFHPGIALVAAVIVLLAGLRAAYEGPRLARRLGLAVSMAVCAQVLAGFVNVLLLAPVWMQMAHLVLADGVWIAFVLLGAASLAVERQASSVERRASSVR